MRAHRILRADRRANRYQKEDHENFRKTSSGRHSIGHQTGPRPTVSMILRDRTGRRHPRMRLEKIPNDVGRVQIVARLADPFFRQPALAAGPDMPESADAAILDLSALDALIVSDFEHALAASRPDLRSAAEHPLPLLQ